MTDCGLASRNSCAVWKPALARNKIGILRAERPCPKPGRSELVNNCAAGPMASADVLRWFDHIASIPHDGCPKTIGSASPEISSWEQKSSEVF